MKESMKKVFSMLLAVAMVVCLAACGEEKKEDAKQEPAPQTTAEATGEAETEESAEKGEFTGEEAEVATVVDGFMKAFLSLDGSAVEYVEDGSDVEKSVSEMTVDNLKDAIKGEMGAAEMDDALADKLATTVAECLADVLSDAEYEVESVSIDGEQAEAVVLTRFPDFGSVDGDMGEPTDYFTEEELGEITAKLLENPEMTKEEQMELVMELMVDKIPEIIEKKVSDAGTVEERSEVLLKKDGDKWVIAEMEDIVPKMDEVL